MKIGVIGASGKAGSLIAKEALERGHEVTAIVRNSSKVKDERLKVVEKDLLDLTAEDLKGFDVVVNAFRAADGEENLYVDAGRVLIAALKELKDTRLVIVGGAGSLFVDEEKTLRLFDTPDFPKEYFPTAKNMGDSLIELQNTKGIKWTFISPAAFFDAEGKKTGKYTKGKENLIVNAKGDSYISYADYAIAFVDEIESAEHVNERFTVVAERA